jgi:predicted DNA-binding transcriptional regulator AlpA
MNIPEVPAHGFLRKRDIIGDRKANPPILGILPVSDSTWRRGVKEGRYPAPVKLGARAVAWRVEDIRRLVSDLSQRQVAPLPSVAAMPQSDLLGAQSDKGLL